MNAKAIFAVINTSWAVVKIWAEKNSGLYGIWTYDLCDTGVVLYQLSWQKANWELVSVLVKNEPMKWWINDLFQALFSQLLKAHMV